MPEQDRRTSRRLINESPLRFRPMKATSIPEETAASMNISTHGVFFATEQKVSKGCCFKCTENAREIIGDDVEEWSFTARVAPRRITGRSKRNLRSWSAVPLLRGSPGFDLETSHSAQFANGTAHLINKSISRVSI